MNVDLSRRSFLKLAGAGVAVTSVGAMGFGEAEAAEVAHVRAFKLFTTTEARNTCPYCSVACGVILFSKGDATSGPAELVHVEGDADHPTNRGTLCPRASGSSGARGPRSSSSSLCLSRKMGGSDDRLLPSAVKSSPCHGFLPRRIIFPPATRNRRARRAIAL